MTTVLVTGSTGFLGSYLVERCARLGIRVLAQVRRPVHSRLDNVVPIAASLFDLDILAAAMTANDCAAIFHLAAALPGQAADASTYASANVHGTAALLDLYRRSAATDFVLASSLYAIGPPQRLPVDEKHPAAPNHPYFASKLSAEVFCQECARGTGKAINVLRIASPYGPGMPSTVLLVFLRAAAEGRDIVLHGSGSRVQNFIHAEDVARAFLHVLGKQVGTCLIGGDSISMALLAALALRLAGRDPSEASFSGQPDPQEHVRWLIDDGKFRGTGFVSETTLEQGSVEMLAWLRSGAPRRPWWTE